MMRRILVDHARRRKAIKRSGGLTRVMLDEGVAQSRPADVDILDLDVALSELASFDSRKSRLVELRFFGGLSLEESAEALGVSAQPSNGTGSCPRLAVSSHDPRPGGTHYDA